MSLILMKKKLCLVLERKRRMFNTPATKDAFSPVITTSTNPPPKWRPCIWIFLAYLLTLPVYHHNELNPLNLRKSLKNTTSIILINFHILQFPVLRDRQIKQGNLRA